METHWIVLLSVVGWLLCGYVAVYGLRKLGYPLKTNRQGLIATLLGAGSLLSLMFDVVITWFESPKWKAWLDKEAKWIL